MALELSPRIVVIGVGGAGGNAVNNMIESNLRGVEFVVANTDAQALTRSRAPVHIQLGVSRTEGLGAGANPEVGAEAAKESAEEIKKLLHGAHMCFIAAGMGGGTGTGAAPIIARIAKEQKVLTVGVVTKPFDFEGKRRMAVAEKGIVELRSEVDTLIIIPNQNLFRIASRETTFAEAFNMADRVLHSGVRGITDLMVMPGLINLDFADVRTVMAGMGTAIMGTGEGEGENRALRAAQLAIANPLLDDVSIRGAKGVLINITGGYDMTLFEVDEAANEVRREVDVDAHIILGSTFDETMSGSIRVSVVAAGILQTPVARAAPAPAPALLAEPVAALVSPVATPPPAPMAELGADPELAPVRTGAPIIRTGRPAPIEEIEEIDEPEELLLETAPAPVHALTREQEPLKMPQLPPESANRSFASLFGWRAKPAHEESAPAPPHRAAPDDESFDDELEIPAFLRRSANT
ncbi:MAG: cell division protein FtsZ [Alphaproteobacteria bacterium]|nr:cell division protein FtsZ [Alphaproteobacteria bacterium]